MYMDYFKNRHYTAFRITGQEEERFWYILEREVFNFETGSASEFSALTTGTNSGFLTITNLEPAENELYYLIPGVKDGCTYYFKLTVGNESWGVQRDMDIGYIDNIRSPHYLPDAQYGFFTALKTVFQVRANNNTGSTVTPQLFFEGMKYRIKEIKENSETHKRLSNGQIPFSKIQLGGFTH